MYIPKISEQEIGIFAISMIVSFALGWAGCWLKWVLAAEEDETFFNKK